jgi:tetratricopeptide (TPR) repeat protein
MATRRRSAIDRLIRVLVFVILGLLVIITGLLALRGVVRALPGRYAYYLPDPLQELRHVEHDGMLPTPDGGIQATPMTPLLMTPSSTVPPSTATVTPQPTSTPQSQGGATPAPTTPAPTATASPTSTPLPEQPVVCQLEGVRAERQGWNNCGPTTLAMALSYWGRGETQTEIAPALKPDPEDKNVGPYEMAEYARALGFEATVRVGGTIDLLRRLVANDFPVVVETWYIDEEGGQMGHYRLVTGYDDAAQHFTTVDSLHVEELRLSYQELDELWRAFNRLYLVIVPPERQAEVAEILGPYMDTDYAFQEALKTARVEATGPPEPCVAYVRCEDARMFAWFNVGSSLVALEQYEAAASAFDQARALGVPFRMIWYQFGPYEAYYAVGRYEDVIALADETLRIANNLEESYYWRGKARQALGDIAGARADFQAALRYHEGWAPALEALDALSPD